MHHQPGEHGGRRGTPSARASNGAPTQMGTTSWSGGRVRTNSEHPSSSVELGLRAETYWRSAPRLAGAAVWMRIAGGAGWQLVDSSLSGCGAAEALDPVTSCLRRCIGRIEDRGLSGQSIGFGRSACASGASLAGGFRVPTYGLMFRKSLVLLRVGQCRGRQAYRQDGLSQKSQQKPISKTMYSDISATVH